MTKWCDEIARASWRQLTDSPEMLLRRAIQPAIPSVDEHNISPHYFVMYDEIVWRKPVGSGKIEAFRSALPASDQEPLLRQFCQISQARAR